jgi:hypothetical protein
VKLTCHLHLVSTKRLLGTDRSVHLAVTSTLYSESPVFEPLSGDQLP